MGAHEHITINEYAMTLIRIKARQLIGKYGFTTSDRDDIEQELVLDLLLRLDRFDPGKGRPATYIKMVVHRRVVGLIRERVAAARDYRRTSQSLDGAAGEAGEAMHMEPAVDRDPVEDLRIDLQAAVDTLPNSLRSLSEQLSEDTVAGVARRNGRSREATRQAVRALRRHFQAHGIADYLPDNHFRRRSRK